MGGGIHSIFHHPVPVRVTLVRQAESSIERSEARWTDRKQWKTNTVHVHQLRHARVRHKGARSVATSITLILGRSGDGGLHAPPPRRCGEAEAKRARNARIRRNRISSSWSPSAVYVVASIVSSVMRLWARAADGNSERIDNLRTYYVCDYASMDSSVCPQKLITNDSV